MRAGIVHKPDSLSIAKEVCNFLIENGIDAVILEDWNEAYSYDFLVSVGGDGTILRLLQFLRDVCPPIFGINTGKVGLLTHCEYKDYKEHLSEAINTFEIEKFMRLECSLDLLALNEIAVLTAKPAKMINVKIKVDDVEIEDIRCDGMLFSTPLGSTAYALSTGGPIIDPSIECILIVPVAPFKLGWKPWVISANKKIEVEVTGKAFVVADGHDVVEIESSTITIKKSKKYATFFKIKNRIKNIIKKLLNLR